MPLAVDKKETILCSIVALLQDAKKQSIDQNDVSEILRSPITIAQLPDGSLLFESAKSQLQIQVRKSRVEVRDLSDGPMSERTLANHLKYLVNLMGGVVTSIGLNVQMNIPLVGDEKAGPLLARQLLNANWVESSFNGRVMGFGGVINFQLDDNSKWNVRLNPRSDLPESSEIFVNLNHSIPTDPPLTTPLSDNWVNEMESKRRADEQLLDDFLRRF